jgi:hypothetical protein
VIGIFGKSSKRRQQQKSVDGNKNRKQAVPSVGDQEILHWNQHKKTQKQRHMIASLGRRQSNESTRHPGIAA